MLNNIYMETFAYTKIWDSRDNQLLHERQNIIVMFIAHIVFFSLHESSHYLVQAGHPQDTLQSL